jgi:hypothetical protein
MKFAKWIAILLMVLLSGFFLISSEKGVEEKYDKNKPKIKIKFDHDIHIDLDFLDDLDICLKDLDEKIEKMVEARLKDLEITVDLEGLEHRLESLNSLECLKDIKIKAKNLAEIECMKVLKKLESFFEDFEWDIYWDWDYKKSKKMKFEPNSKNKEDI